MQLLSYKEALKLSKEKLKETLIPVRVNKARKQAELEMCKIDEDIAVKESDLHDECCKEDVNFSRIIELQDQIGLLERKRRQYESIIEQMFPSN